MPNLKSKKRDWARREVLPMVLRSSGFFVMLVAVPIAAGEPPAEAHRVIAWRPDLQAGQWCYVWSHNEKLKGELTLRGPGGAVTPERYLVGWPRPWYRDHIDTGFRVPLGTAPGEYQLEIGGRSVGVTVTVRPVKARSGRKLIRPNGGADDADRIETALRESDVDLAGGTYTLRRPVRATAGRHLRGYGATLLREADGRSYREHMIVPADGFTVEGVTFKPVGWVFGQDPTPARNVTLLDCEIRGGGLGRWGACDGLLVQECRFIQAGAGPVCGGMFLRCRWSGVASAEHAFHCEGNNGPLAVLDAVFDGTDRGLVLRPSWGPMRDALFAGLDFRNINRVANGNELITSESGKKVSPFPVERCMFLHLRASNCDSQINFWDATVRDCVLWDGVLDGGGGIWFSGHERAEQTGNVVRDYELRNCGVVFGPTATGNRLERVTVAGWRPSRVNGGWQDNRPGGPFRSAAAAFDADGPQAASNTCVECWGWGLPPNVALYRGVTWR